MYAWVCVSAESGQGRFTSRASSGAETWSSSESGAKGKQVRFQPGQFLEYGKVFRRTDSGFPFVDAGMRELAATCRNAA